MAGPMRARTSVVLGLALLAGGALFGSPSLYPAGIALLLLPLAAIAWVQLAATRARIDRELPPGPLLEGRVYPLRLRLRAGLLPAPAGELRDPLLGEPRPVGAGPGAREIDAEVSFSRRGRQALGCAELLISDPFGLSARSRRSADGGELVVLPRIEALQFGPGGSDGALGLGPRGLGGSGPDSWAAEFEVDGLRLYREGSPASRIHWPTVARTGELHERRITSGADAARLVVLDPSAPASEEALDRAVRAAASICRELGSGSGCLLLIGGEPRLREIEPRLRNFEVAHQRLALVEADAGVPAVHRLGRAGVVFWVSADPSRGPEQRLRRLPALRPLLVRPCRTGGGSGATPTFRVAGCEARELGARAGGRWSGAAA